MKEMNLLLDKIQVIAKMSDSISFVYDLTNDSMQCVDYKEENEKKYEIKNYCLHLLNGEFVHPDDKKQVESLCNAISEGEKELFFSFRYSESNSAYHWKDWYGKTIFDKNKIPIKIIGWISSSMHLDSLMMFMLEQMNIEQNEILFNEKLLENIAEILSVDAIQFVGYGINNQKQYQYFWNKNTCKFLNCMDVNFTSLNLEMETCDYRILTEKEWKKLGLISTKIKSAIVVKKWSVTNQNYAYLLLMNCKFNRIWNDKEIHGLNLIISALVFAEERKIALTENKGLKEKISKDGITGLSKIEVFKTEAMKFINENKDVKYAIINSGFYNFQYINDNYGYAIGDAILHRFGRFMKNELSKGRMFARGSGDQFIFLVECEDVYKIKEQFIAYCKRFCNDIENEIGINSLTITSGLCFIENNGTQKIAKAIDNANLTRKVIKNKAETNCIVFKNESRANIAEQMHLTAKMKKALENEEFVAYLQPKTDLKSGEVIGAEALVRWIQKDGTMIYPDQFIPLFEDNGFVSQIDFYMLQRVLIYLTKRKNNGLPLFPISVNFSRRHQENPNFVNDIVALLDEYEIDRKWIEIEITESAFMNDMKELHKNLESLRKNHICISIDDFGSGYSSLNVLATVPADIIKIDRVFLEQSDMKSKNMLKYLILMIKGMGYRTIVEGVETKEQMMYLREIGCEMAQGYYYAKPMPKPQFDIYCLQHGIVKEFE